MLKVLDQTAESNEQTVGEAVGDPVPTLDAVARAGAQRMLLAALEEEV